MGDDERALAGGLDSAGRTDCQGFVLAATQSASCERAEGAVREKLFVLRSNYQGRCQYSRNWYMFALHEHRLGNSCIDVTVLGRLHRWISELWPPKKRNVV